MSHYELMVIFKPTLSEEEFKAQVENVKSLLEKNGAEISYKKEYGVKNLGYEIQKNKRGFFFNMLFKAPASSIKEIERVLRLTEEVLKFMTVKFESKKELQAWSNGVKGGSTSIMVASQKRRERRAYIPRENRDRDGREKREYRDNKESSAPNEEAAPVAKEAKDS